MSKFVAMGTLNLANNDLDWQEVGKLRHMHILDLSLHGNAQLEKDPYCKYGLDWNTIINKLIRSYRGIQLTSLHFSWPGHQTWV